MSATHWQAEPPVPGRALDKILCKRLQIPRAVVHPMLRGLKRATIASRVRDYRRLSATTEASKDLAIDRSEGYRLFDAGSLPSWAAAREYCLSRFEQARAEEAATRGNLRKEGFLRTVASGDELVRQPDCLRLMLDPALLASASQYLGEVPHLAGAALWWSPPNRTAQRSQLWHIDDEDRHQVKVLINLTDTGPEQGPFTLIARQKSEQIIARLAARRWLGNIRRVGRLTDEEVVEIAGGENPAVPVMGPAGHGVMVDSSACLHHGSRGNLADRLVLMFHFLPWDTPTSSTFRFRRTGPLPEIDLNELQRKVLGVR